MLAIITLLIIYGSLFPFNFTEPASYDAEIAKLLNFTFWNARFSDAVANVFLFIPFGLAFPRCNANRVLNVGIFLMAAFVVAYAVQVLQIWLPSRVPYGGDAVWNMFGAMFGLACQPLLPVRTTPSKVALKKTLPYGMLLLALLLVETMPFVPSLDVQVIKKNVLSLLDVSSFRVIDTLQHACFYALIVSFYLHAYAAKWGKFLPLLLLPVYVFLKLFLQFQVTDINLVVGSLLGGALAYRSSLQSLAGIAYLSLGFIVFNALGTFEYRENHAPINWVPFLPAMSGNVFISIIAIIEKGFYYFLFLLFSVLSGKSLYRSTTHLLFIVVALELLQRNIKGATPDLTEAVVILIISFGTYKWLKERFPNVRRALENDVSAMTQRVSHFLLLAITLVVTALGLFFVLPHYPIHAYFLEGGSVQSCLFVALTVVVLTYGIMAIANSANHEGKAWRHAGWQSILLGMLVLLLLKNALLESWLLTWVNSSAVTGVEGLKHVGQLLAPFLLFATWLNPFICIAIVCVVRVQQHMMESRRAKPPWPAKQWLYFILWLVPWILAGQLIQQGYLEWAALIILLWVIVQFWSDRVTTTGSNEQQQRASRKALPTAAMLAMASAMVAAIWWRYDSIAPNASTLIPWAANDASIIFDHHTHTKYSDGNFTVAALATMAAENGCNALAITDHTDVKRMRSMQRIDDIRVARLQHPELMIIAGAELNPPQYQGREHVSLLVSPSFEQPFFSDFHKVLNSNHFSTDAALFEYLASQPHATQQLLAIYNHPSRKDEDPLENDNDFLTWHTLSGGVLIGMSGAPGHQRSATIGSYRQRITPIDRWDPVVAEVGGTVDRLLENGHNPYAAIASSDFHNTQMDFAPCAFSRIHVSAPTQDYNGLFTALHAGTFWASHGKFLSQFKLRLELNDAQRLLHPGETATASLGSMALLSVKLGRELAFVEQDIAVEVITNCVSGKVEPFDPVVIPAYQTDAQLLLPLTHMGADNKSCFVRSRARLLGSPSYLAYTNHIRIFLNKE